MKYKLLLILSAILFAHLFFNKGYEKEIRAFQFDKGGYYVYLPAAFIYQDIGRLHFFKSIDSIYHPNGTRPEDRMYGIYTHPQTKNRFVKYSIGTAVCEMPMFLLAHVFSSVTGFFAADGYTVPYRISILFSTILCVMWGLWFLHKFLLRYFSDKAVFTTLLLLLYGTNLYYYSSFDPGMSHPFSFGILCMLLYTTDQWTVTGRMKYALLSGLCAGMLVILRPVNLLVLAIPLCWQVYNQASFRSRLNFYRAQRVNIAVAVLGFLAVAMIQMAYWKHTTGHWIFFSYVDEGFKFGQPHIPEGLFSYRKGWYVYTPIAFIATLGLIPLWRYRRVFAPSVLVFFLVYIYVVFCWDPWFYGGSFGCRPLIDILPLMAMPLCAFIQWILSLRYKIFHWTTATVLLFFVTLNIFQTYQFTFGTIHHTNMNEAYYWRIFGKEKATDEDWKLLQLH